MRVDGAWNRVVWVESMKEMKLEAQTVDASENARQLMERENGSEACSKNQTLRNSSCGRERCVRKRRNRGRALRCTCNSGCEAAIVAHLPWQDTDDDCNDGQSMCNMHLNTNDDTKSAQQAMPSGAEDIDS